MSKKQFEYEIIKIREDTYIVNEFYSTMAVLVGKSRALVIDCGTGVGDFRAVVESLTHLPYDVVATHAHVDHVGGRGQFTDLYVSAADTKYVHGVGTGIRRIYAVMSKYTMNCRFSGIAITKTATEPTLHTLNEGDIFDLGDRQIRAILTPGHTVGSASFLDITNRMIFIGDVANENLLMFLPHATTIDEMIATHRKILATEGYDKVWASHHTEPLTRADLERFLRAAEHVSNSRARDAVLPCITAYRYNEGRDVLIYRPSNVHGRRK